MMAIWLGNKFASLQSLLSEFTQDKRNFKWNKTVSTSTKKTSKDQVAQQNFKQWNYDIGSQTQWTSNQPWCPDQNTRSGAHRCRQPDRTLQILQRSSAAPIPGGTPMMRHGNANIAASLLPQADNIGKATFCIPR